MIMSLNHSLRVYEIYTSEKQRQMHVRHFRKQDDLEEGPAPVTESYATLVYPPAQQGCITLVMRRVLLLLLLSSISRSDAMHPQPKEIRSIAQSILLPGWRWRVETYG